MVPPLPAVRLSLEPPVFPVSSGRHKVVIYQYTVRLILHRHYLMIPKAEQDGAGDIGGIYN